MGQAGAPSMANDRFSIPVRMSKIPSFLVSDESWWFEKIIKYLKNKIAILIYALNRKSSFISGSNNFIGLDKILKHTLF